MEALSQALQPHKDLVGSVASVVTIGQFFSGAFICKDIYKKQSTEGTNAIPFIGGITIGILMLQYGLMLEDIVMLQVNAAAIILNVIYVFFYYLYCSEKWDELFKPSAFGTALVAILLAYINYEDPSLVETRFGLVVTVLMLLLLGSPLLEVKAIIQNKDASSIPFPMTFMGAIVTFLWLLYGIILMNHFMVVQNFVGLLLCLVQLLLCFIYSGTSGQATQKKKRHSKRE